MFTSLRDEGSRITVCHTVSYLTTHPVCIYAGTMSCLMAACGVRPTLLLRMPASDIT